MNFLFLTDEFYPNFGANSLVVRTVCRGLAEKGHRVFVAPAAYDGSLPAKEEWEGICILRGMPGDTKENFKKYLKQGKFFTAAKLMHVLLWAKVAGPHKLGHKKGICARSWLEDLIQQENIDVAVSINCSIERGFPLLYLKEKRKISAKWYLYMLDPFEDHEYYRTHQSVKSLRRLQHRMMRSCDRVLATELIYQGVARWECPCILKKITKTEFPKIEKPTYTECADDISLDPDFTHVVCTGSKNEQVRSSTFALTLCKQVEDLPVQFHFVGYGWVEGSEAKKDGNCIFYPPHSPQSAKNLQLKADFLLNIGNKVVNQLPSKVLEYISTGKPIINVYKDEKCPAKALLEGSDSLNLWEGETPEIATEKLRAFLRETYKTCSFPEIENRFLKYTPPYVTEQFLTEQPKCGGIHFERNQG